MFKADGTPIQRPRAFVAKINKYAGGLFTADGTAIRDPNSFLTVLKHRKRRGAAAALRSTNPTNGQNVIDKDAEPLAGNHATSPTAANGRNCESEAFYGTACWQGTPNPPNAIFATGRIPAVLRRGKGGAPTGAPALRVGANVVYKADGTPIRNLSAFVANIDNYEGGLFTGEGQAINNPHTYLSLLEQRGLNENPDFASNIDGVYRADSTEEPMPEIAIRSETWDDLKSNIQEPSYNAQRELPSKDDSNNEESLRYNVAGVPLTGKLPLTLSKHQLIYPDIGFEFPVKNTFIELNWYKPVVQARRARSADGRQNLS